MTRTKTHSFELIDTRTEHLAMLLSVLGVCPEACPARRAHLETGALETRRTRDETSISLCPVLSTCSLFWCAQTLIDLLAAALAVASEPYT